MRFLSVADRELRAAARQKTTYRARWLTAALFFVLLVWLLWVFQGLRNQRIAAEIFRAFSILAFVYCSFLSAARTADCISSERREGTLGLLFLTNLNSAEIIAGKLCSTALASVYALLAIFPMLALPMMLGGISFGFFLRTVLALLNGILFALAAGFLASVVCKRQFIAVALALSLTLGLGGGLLLGAAVANAYTPTRPLASWLAAPSPFYTLLAADNTRGITPSGFWLSAAAVTGLWLGCLGLTTLLLARTWRDRPKTVLAWPWPRGGKRSERTPSAARAALRRRLLAINPLFWLASRRRVSSPVLMGLAVVLTALTVYVAAPFFGRKMGAGGNSPIVGCLFAWLWTGLVLHALVLYHAATTASQRLAEDKQAGALELLLSTPTSERTLSRGLWLAYWRSLFFPALLAVLVHCFFIWMVMVLMVLEPPGSLPPRTTPGELFWSALLNQPLRGQALNWQCSFILRLTVLILLQLMVTWPTLGWVGRWLGLRMKHAGFAPIGSLALLIVPPVLLFSLACYLADKLHLDQLPESQIVPLMMWLAFGIGCTHCLGLSVWAATRLRYHLRAVALSRYQPLPAWRWRLPKWRTVRRVAFGMAGAAAAVAALVTGYYGYQNWHSRRAWSNFQTALKQQGESLNLAPLLPAPVPEAANLARSPAFLGLLSGTNRNLTGLFERMRQWDLANSSYQGNSVLMEWSHRTNAPLQPFVTWTSPQSQRSSGPQRADEAAAILHALDSRYGNWREVATAAARLPAFQTTTNCGVSTVFQSLRPEVLLLERVHLLFQVRACAALALSQNPEAADDVLTGLRLARLARQVPDVHATTRVQALLAHSLQPLWEGLYQHAWTEPQLAALQQELAGFDLLADYTNAVRRVVLAHIEVWRTMPDRQPANLTLPTADGGHRSEPAWAWQPRAWWFESCIQLHTTGRKALEAVDAAGGRIAPAIDWSDVSGLPLDGSSQQLLQQSCVWWGANPASVAFAQTSVNQAIIACALERFRLAHGAYPKTLEQLVPALLDRLPHDAVSGRPLLYQYLGKESFLLRGVGPNGTDDRKNGAGDDWLWTYQTNTPVRVSGNPSVKPRMDANKRE